MAAASSAEGQRQRVRDLRLDSLQSTRHRAAAVHAPHPAGERTAHRHGGRRGGGGRLGRDRRAFARAELHPRTRAPPGLHGRAGGRRPVAMRDAMRDLGGDPARIDPELPSNLVIDHSVQVDAFASRGAMARNTELEFERNRERYAFLRFGQQAFDGLTVVPPATGIVHQVNLEFLARVVQEREAARPSRTRCSAPTRTRRWSTASACSAGRRRHRGRGGHAR